MMIAEFDGTLKSLTILYRTIPESPYHNVKPATKRNYDTFCRLIENELGNLVVAEIRDKEPIVAWLNRRKGSMVVSLARMIRVVIGFGAKVIQDSECQRLSAALHRLAPNYARPERREVSSEQTELMRAKANAMGVASIALVHAFQHDTDLWQGELIGSWYPASHPAASEIIRGNWKWVGGLAWSEIDERCQLEHDGLRGVIRADLTAAPMVLEELAQQYPGCLQIDPATGRPKLVRAALPIRGPVIISEFSGLPWKSLPFRERWREVAEAAGITKAITNSDFNSRRSLIATRLNQSQAEGRRLREVLERICREYPGTGPYQIASHGLTGGC